MGGARLLFSTCGHSLVAPIRWLTSATAVFPVVSMVIVVEAISHFLVVACTTRAKFHTQTITLATESLLSVYLLI